MHFIILYFQAFLIAVTAQFIPLLVYRYRDPNPEIRMSSPAYMEDNLQRSLGGYVRYSLSEFPISALLNDDNNPFPLPSAISLNYYENDDDDEPTDFYFQPYHISVECLNNTFNNMFVASDFPPLPPNATELLPYFKESTWDTFTATFPIGPGERNRSQYLQCVNANYTCK